MQSAPAPVNKEEPKQASAPVASNDGTKVTAPMQGTILEVKAKVGDAVKEGDTLLILEAMKLENEIKAPVAGKVASIVVSKGASVNASDLLVVLE